MNDILAISLLIIITIFTFYVGYSSYKYFKAKKQLPDSNKEDQRWAHLYTSKGMAAMVLAIAVLLALFIKFIFWLFRL